MELPHRRLRRSSFLTRQTLIAMSETIASQARRIFGGNESFVPEMVGDGRVQVSQVHLLAVSGVGNCAGDSWRSPVGGSAHDWHYCKSFPAVGSCQIDLTVQIPSRGSAPLEPEGLRSVPHPLENGEGSCGAGPQDDVAASHWLEN